MQPNRLYTISNIVLLYWASCYSAHTKLDRKIYCDWTGNTDTEQQTGNWTFFRFSLTDCLFKDLLIKSCVWLSVCIFFVCGLTPSIITQRQRTLLHLYNCDSQHYDQFRAGHSVLVVRVNCWNTFWSSSKLGQQTSESPHWILYPHPHLPPCSNSVKKQFNYLSPLLFPFIYFQAHLSQEHCQVI